jgi:hypothetical protein
MRGWLRLAAPDPDSLIVREQEDHILLNLKLDDVVGGLKRSEFLLWSAYNGVAGFGDLRAQVSDLQHMHLEICSEAVQKLDLFSTFSGSVLTMSKRFFTYLLKPNIDMAMKYMKSASDAAGQLAAEAQDLAAKFKELAEKTEKARGDTERKQGEQQQEQTQETKDANDIAAQLGKAADQLQNYEHLCAVAQQNVNRAYEDMRDERERAFGLKLISAIVKPLAAGLGALGSAYAAQRTGGLSAGLISQTTAEQPLPDRGSEGDGGTTSLTQSASELAKTSPSGPPPDASPLPSKQAAAAAGSAAAKQAADSTAQTVDPMDAQARDAKDVYLALLDVQQKREDKRIEYAGLMKQFAAKLASKQEEVQVTLTAIAALQIAVAALRQVEVSLISASSFWAHMQQECAVLANIKTGKQEPTETGLAAEIAIHKDDPDMLEAFKSDDFKVMVVTYYAGWQALTALAKQYGTMAEDSWKSGAEHMNTTPDESQSRQNAVELGRQLQLLSEGDIKAATQRKAASQIAAGALSQTGTAARPAA